MNHDWKQYEAEVKERWGQTEAYKEHAARTGAYSKQKWDDLAEELDGIMGDFALCMRKGETPDSAAARAMVAVLQNHITAHYYRCTKEILAGLGQMYVADERFRTNIDKHGDGTAAFVRDAIQVFCAEV